MQRIETHIYRLLKSEIGEGVAATTGNRTESASLPIFSSVFATKTNAIHLALNTISATKGKIFFMFTDSRSCLQDFKSKNRSNQMYEN